MSKMSIVYVAIQRLKCMQQQALMLM